MNDYRYTLSLTLQAPLLTQSVGALGFGFDLSTLRDDKTPVLPGSLVRGNLRETLERFAEILGQNGQADLAEPLERQIKDWFGPRAKADDPSFGHARAQLTFDYYWRCQPFARAAMARNRISLDPDTGTVKQGALIVIDAAGGQDRAMVFTGTISARFEDAGKAEEARKWLEKAAQFLPAVGSLKGAGYGKVLGAQVTMEAPPPSEPKPLPKTTERLGLRLSLDRPFCLAQARAAQSNQFSGDEAIAGAALKAVLARRLGEDAISLPLDQLVFSHALPSPENAPARRSVLPMSLAWVGDAWSKDKTQPIKENLVDLALLDRDEADFVCERTGKAAKFQIDWKDKEHQAARQLIDAVPGCARHLAVHTAIDPETGQSDEGKIFSLDCVDPKGMAWLADIDLSALDEQDRPSVAAKLAQALSRPLVGLGKTKAIVTATLQPKPFLEPAPLKPQAGCFVITLQTPAALFDDQATGTISASGGGQALHDCYAAYWRSVSGGSLTLKRFFAAQERKGGAFVWHYYLKHVGSPDKRYRPFWLTAAGSVFVLAAAEGRLDEAGRLIETWRRLGLPPPDGKPKPEAWPYNPYLRENGYGEIRVNDPIHTDFFRKEEQWL